MLKRKCIIIAGEEAGPKSNKMGGIWNVIDAEVNTLASMLADGTLKEENVPRIFVAGPYFGHSGSDWNKGLNRITDLSEFDEYEPDEELSSIFEKLNAEGIEIVIGSRNLHGIEVVHLMFKTNNFCRESVEYKGQTICLENKIKAEAYDLVGLDSLTYEELPNRNEYSHYLNLSYAISEFVNALVDIRTDKSKQYEDKAMSEFVASLMPTLYVSLHCHEFGVFYSIARLKKLGVTINSVATHHATIPGRAAGHRSIQKIRDNDSSWGENVSLNMGALESLSSYADVVTAVGDSTKKEIKLFYGIDSIIVRNGIDLESVEFDKLWEKKKQCRERMQKIAVEKLYNAYDGLALSPEKIIPIFSISRIEIENKGYPDLLDSLVLLDRMVKIEIEGGRLDEDYRVICFIITAHGPKTNLPGNFPLQFPEETLMGEEIRLQKMIVDRGLECSKLSTGKRYVSAVLYPQWLSKNDGGFDMSVDEFMAGCIAGIFPSRYEPFLLTGLEAGKEATPSVVSKVCGFSDALQTLKRLVMGMGGVVVVDNIDLSYLETVADYALAMDYFIDTYTYDKVKYNLLCQEANLLARDMNWREPVKQYYEMLTGKKAI
ncbi:glycosyltransferase involved in cell wall biosynthesis [Methanohalophilus levihalophilus]|uniref:glycogen synthase n=1 Tax=Methanohalophilus levihalophilus TaxID=1431282 RepID=UPI001AE72BD7|nr:glycogen synthase [Methanohalophilus levihalophilus]MBP2030679.1 glycosyltransferase involved in cell wall biosynthesis [Methanohalophilus levihalophilus]